LINQSNLFQDPNIAKLFACHKTLRALVSESKALSLIFLIEFHILIILDIDRLVRTALSDTSLTASKASNSLFKSEFCCSKAEIFSHNLSALSACSDKFNNFLLTCCSSLSFSCSGKFFFKSSKIFDSFSSADFVSSSKTLNFNDLILSTLIRLFLDK
jgi:hypothetical protein